MKFYVDPEECIGCGICAGTEEAVFKMNDEGKAEAYQDATPENEENAQSAMENCPVDAIKQL
ncbi:MAG: ferredoxin [Lachnotalea sp.]